MTGAFFPGRELLDTAGNKVEAHAGAIFREGGRYYLYGEDKSHTDGKNGIWTWGIRCYSSEDLYTWQDEGHIIPPEPDDPSSWRHPSRQMDRPHIVYCERTKKYVCWLKYSGKTEACFSVLTADRLSGPYREVRTAFRPFGKEAGDFDIWEKDGAAFLYFAEGSRGIAACRLTDDYTDVTEPYRMYYQDLPVPYAREGVALTKFQNRLYLFTSGMTGYIPNPSEAAKLSAPLGELTPLENPHRADDSGASFCSQISKIVPLPGKQGTFLVLADRWIPGLRCGAAKTEQMMRALAACLDKRYHATLWEKMQLGRLPWNCRRVNTSLSRYVWLPLTFEGEQPVIRWKDPWTLEECT